MNNQHEIYAILADLERNIRGLRRILDALVANSDERHEYTARMVHVFTTKINTLAARMEEIELMYTRSLAALERLRTDDTTRIDPATFKKGIS